MSGGETEKRAAKESNDGRTSERASKWTNERTNLESTLVSCFAINIFYEIMKQMKILRARNKSITSYLVDFECSELHELLPTSCSHFVSWENWKISIFNVVWPSSLHCEWRVSEREQSVMSAIPIESTDAIVICFSTFPSVFHHRIVEMRLFRIDGRRRRKKPAPRVQI